MITINLYYGFVIIHNGKIWVRTKQIFEYTIGSKIYSSSFSQYISHHVSLFSFFSMNLKNPFFLEASFLLYFTLLSFFILIFIVFAFFSSPAWDVFVQLDKLLSYWALLSSSLWWIETFEASCLILISYTTLNASLSNRLL